MNEKLAECERQQQEISSRLFCVDRFTTDGDISFYTGLSSYATFMAIFQFLNPGDDCENIRPRSSVTDVPEDFYDSDFFARRRVVLFPFRVDFIRVWVNNVPIMARFNILFNPWVKRKKYGFKFQILFAFIEADRCLLDTCEVCENDRLTF